MQYISDLAKREVGYDEVSELCGQLLSSLPFRFAAISLLLKEVQLRIEV